MSAFHKFQFQIPMLALVALFGFSSCKKGENDPMSLRTRDNRVVGTWKLTQYDYAETLSETSANTSGSSTTSDVTFGAVKTGNGTSLTSTYNYHDISTHGTSSSTESFQTIVTENYGLEVSINDDETARVRITNQKINITKISIPADVCGGGNTPNLANSHNYGESNVADISCDGTYTYGNPENTTYTVNGYWSWLDGKKNKVEIRIDNLGTFMIDRLANKELVLIDNRSGADGSVQTGSNSAMNSTITSRWMFEKQ